MRRTFGLELGTGLFVLLGIAAVFFLATQTTNLHALNQGETYEVRAAFSNVGGLKVSAPVALAGVQIGRVSSITLDPQSLQAVVTMRIQKRYDEIPVDSSAAIQTRGLLGDQYIGITPGGSLQSLKSGDTVHFTQSAIVLENLISQFMFHSASSGGKSNGGP
ncbi:MAG TPA: outer membrane lipid asymmetry maintenance protein MlaD [Gammaproteobacteria bacterium]|nr:outer membrane lipid asymmetry maintenance protein MlaD [Gammaproteobacteria bacterium]